VGDKMQVAMNVSDILTITRFRSRVGLARTA